MNMNHSCNILIVCNTYHSLLYFTNSSSYFTVSFPMLSMVDQRILSHPQTSVAVFSGASLVTGTLLLLQFLSSGTLGASSFLVHFAPMCTTYDATGRSCPISNLLKKAFFLKREIEIEKDMEV